MIISEFEGQKKNLKAIMIQNGVMQLILDNVLINVIYKTNFIEKPIFLRYESV